MRWFALILSLALATESQAGIYGDDLARCLVRSTSDTDKTALIRWVFAITSLHPGVADIAALSPRDAIRYEGAGSLEQSFDVLGEVAMNELMAHPDVGNGFAAFTHYLDESKFEVLRQ